MSDQHAQEQDQSYLDKEVAEWTVQDVHAWAQQTFPNGPIPAWVLQQFIDGLALMSMNEDKLKGFGLVYGPTQGLLTELKTMGLLTARNPRPYKSKMDFRKSKLVETLQDFERYLENSQIGFQSGQWKEVLYQNQSDDSLINQDDSTNKAFVSSVLDQTNNHTTWPTAKALFIATRFPLATDRTWLEYLDSMVPTPLDTLKTFCDRWTMHLRGVLPMCETLRNSPSLCVEALKRQIPIRFYDQIDQRRPLDGFATVQAYIDALKLTFPNNFDSRQVWKDSKQTESTDLQNNKKRKLENHPDHQSIRLHDKVQKTGASFSRHQQSGSRVQSHLDGSKRLRFCSWCNTDVLHSDEDCWEQHPDKAPVHYVFKNSRNKHRNKNQPRRESQQQFRTMEKSKRPFTSIYSCPVSILHAESINGKAIKKDPQCLRILGQIDTGASDLFISHTLVKKLQYKPTTSTPSTIELVGALTISGYPVDLTFKIHGDFVRISAICIETKQGDPDIVIGRSCFHYFGIRISIPFNPDSPTDRFMQERELHVEPSHSVITTIPKAEHDALMKGIHSSLEANKATHGKQSTFPEAQNVSFQVPSQALKWTKQYPLPHALRQTVTDQIAEMEANGVIEPYLGTLNHNNPLTVVAQKDKHRLCVDFRHLNQHIDKGNVTAMPLIDEIFQEVRESRSNFYSTIDLKKAYHKCTVDPKDRWAFTFQWNGKRFQFIGCPFGVSNLPARFSEIMRGVLAGLPNCRNYIDDIIVFSNTLEEHIQHVNDVIERLNKFQFTINTEKSTFGCTTLKLLGHIISIGGTIEIDRSKLSCIDSWDRPRSGKEIQQFLGFANYFRRYFAMETMARPLHEQRDKKIVNWTRETEAAWEDIKEALKKAVPLHAIDYSLPIYIAIDASRAGLGMAAWQDIPTNCKSSNQTTSTPNVCDGSGETRSHSGTGTNISLDSVSLTSASHELATDEGTQRQLTDARGVALIGDKHSVQTRQTLIPLEDMIPTGQSGGHVNSDAVMTEFDQPGSFDSDLQEQTTRDATNISLGEGEAVTHNTNSICDCDCFQRDGTIYKRKFVQFNSRSLRSHERRYGISKLEGLGLVWALQSMDSHIRYSTGEVTVFTDHQALTTIFHPNNELASQTLTSWAEVLMRYQFSLVYVRGVHNIVPDLLSRMYRINHDDLEVLEQHPQLKTMTLLQEEQGNYQLLDDGPKQQQLIFQEHQHGHLGINHTVKRIHHNHHVSWPSIVNDVKTFIQSCPSCAAHQVQQRGFHPLRPIHASLPGDIYAIDAAYMKKSSSIDGYNYCLVVVDVATRFVILRPLHTLEAAELGLAIIDAFCNFGWPKCILSDGGSEKTIKRSNKHWKLPQFKRKSQLLTTTGPMALWKEILQHSKQC